MSTWQEKKERIAYLWKHKHDIYDGWSTFIIWKLYKLTH